MVDIKCVLIINKTLPLGNVTNVDAAISISIDKTHPDTIGDNFVSFIGYIHQVITAMAWSILKSNSEQLKHFLEKIIEYDLELIAVDLIDATRFYQMHIAALKEEPEDTLLYQGH